MSETAFPVFLYVQIPAAADANGYLIAAADAAGAAGGKLRGAATASDVECLEAGTPESSILLVEFPDQAAATNFWESDDNQFAWAPLTGTAGLVALTVNGLPYVGLPEMLEIPSTASVKPPADRGPRAFMVIQGVGTDQVRMDQYRDIILPMIAEQGAYYVCFEIEGQVELLHGDWPHDIFAISRWPDHAAGHAFWDSDRYQNVAIPTRTGAGHFLVHFFAGESG